MQQTDTNLKPAKVTLLEQKVVPLGRLVGSAVFG